MAVKRSTRLDYGARIGRAMALLWQNPAGPPGLQDLADAAAFSPYHFHRIYRSLTGETPAETQARLRLHSGAAALIRGDDPVEKVARQVGYSGAASFTRAFRAAHGIPPAAYRARGGLGEVLSRAEPGEPTMPDVTITDLPALRFVALAHRGDYQRIGAAFEQLAAWAGPRGLLGPGTRCFGRYFDDPEAVPRACLRAEATLAIPEGVLPEPPFHLVELPSLRVAVLRFKGPYAELEGAYLALYRDWLPMSGEEPDSHPAMEEYLNDPRRVPPAALLTDVMLPLKRR